MVSKELLCMLCVIVTAPKQVKKHGVNVTASVKEEERDKGRCPGGEGLLRAAVSGSDPCCVSGKYPGHRDAPH